jgi:prepilin-type N-terminal cleavage/methylation domain-containing protein
MGQSGFTLIEVAVAAAITALVIAGMFKGYNMVGRRAIFSACNLAANATAMQHLERVMAANWVPDYGNLQLFSTNLTAPQTANLCLPSAQSNVVTCTNFTTITQISTNPTYAMIQVQCVWTLPNYGGVFTNTVAILRAPNL